MFTVAWQRRVRAVEHQTAMQVIYQEKFGTAAYAKAQWVKVGLNAHSQRQALRTYLLAEDPYRPS